MFLLFFASQRITKTSFYSEYAFSQQTTEYVPCPRNIELQLFFLLQINRASEDCSFPAGPVEIPNSATSEACMTNTIPALIKNFEGCFPSLTHFYFAGTKQKLPTPQLSSMYSRAL